MNCYRKLNNTSGEIDSGVKLAIFSKPFCPCICLLWTNQTKGLTLNKPHHFSYCPSHSESQCERQSENNAEISKGKAI